MLLNVRASDSSRMQWQSYETGEGASAHFRPLPSSSALFRLLMFTFALFYQARQSLLGKKRVVHRKDEYRS